MAFVLYRFRINVAQEMAWTWWDSCVRDQYTAGFFTISWQQDNAGQAHRGAESTGCINMIGAVLKLIIFTSMVNRIISTTRNERVTQRTWPARSPDLTTYDYFLWGYVKDKMFVPPQPVSVPDLKNRITAAVETITPDLLSRVWQELDYGLDVCRVTSNICRYVS